VVPPVRPARRIGSDTTRPPAPGNAPRVDHIGGSRDQPKPVGRFATVGDRSSRSVADARIDVLGSLAGD